MRVLDVVKTLLHAFMLGTVKSVGTKRCLSHADLPFGASTNHSQLLQLAGSYDVFVNVVGVDTQGA